MDLDVSLKADVFKALGASVVEMRLVDPYYLLRTGFFLSDTQSKHAESSFGITANYYLGAESLFPHGKNRYGIGVSWFDQKNGINGTRWNFAFSYEWRFDGWSVEYLHVSHGSSFGIKTDRPNDGWNMLGGRWSW